MNHQPGNDARTSAPGTAPRPRHDRGDLVLSLRNENIGFVVPPGTHLETPRLELDHGALIAGTFIGRLLCRRGSVVLARGSRVYGSLEADRIYIEGSFLSRPERRSVASARELLAASAHARIDADLASAAFALHGPKLRGKLITLDPQASEVG